MDHSSRRGGGDAGKERLRVLNLCESAQGGAGSYFRHIAALEERGFDMEFVLAQEHVAAVDADLTMTTFPRPRRGSRGLRAMLAAFRARLRAQDPDVCVFHSSFALAALAAMRAAGDRRPAVYCPHGWAVSSYAEAPLRRALVRVLEGRGSGLADVTLCVSEHEREVARALGYRGRFEVVENGVPPPRAEARSDLFGGGTGVIHLLFVGRLDRQKGFDLLAEAFERARRPDLRLHVVGEAVRGDGVARSGGEGIVMHGWVPASRLDDWYALADALVVPSRWEAFGLVVPEALRNGTPVFTSDQGALPSLIEPGRTGGHVPLTVDDLAALLRSLDRQALRAMRPACRAAYETRFRLERQLEELAALLRAVAR
ncbi:glycosyltransferase family 4 protein [Histidinibacterium lentulum]|uniref:Glycosyltransferase family 1 protein n=1 Tax=Histidinibacterium lentulum TaxID=2480588 RepID=A0A3N2QTF0_9RHOB|nr:glycosyltransferase family 4 protein [Histidinibacterium lentulum]ROT98478.1 glycosyltransferase family 1 protein [Histidinibacterium lentulum]